MNANSTQAWTIAWRTPRANRFLRATNWTGTWAQAMNMTRAFNEAHPDQQIYCVTTAAYEADQAARIASGDLPANFAEDFGNILMETGRRVRMIDKGIIDAKLVARTYCTTCIGGQTGDSLAGTWPTKCTDCDGTGVVTPEPAAPITPGCDGGQWCRCPKSTPCYPAKALAPTPAQRTSLTHLADYGPSTTADNAVYRVRRALVDNGWASVTLDDGVSVYAITNAGLRAIGRAARTYAERDSVRDNKWGGTYTGTVTRVADDGAIFVQWHGTSVEDQVAAADIVPAPDVPQPDDNGLRYLTV